ncbi:hypothetical protein WG66_011433 [Moniliophthora roreri]|nr:hypothetical protein WG66_011433 [Moniliophthora roreri]
MTPGLLHSSPPKNASQFSFFSFSYRLKASCSLHGRMSLKPMNRQELTHPTVAVIAQHAHYSGSPGWYYAPLPADSSSSSKSHHAETGSIDSLGRSVERLGPTISPSTVLGVYDKLQVAGTESALMNGLRRDAGSWLFSHAVILENPAVEQQKLSRQVLIVPEPL